MVTLPRSVADVWTSNPGVADVHVTNPRQINLFGKEVGEATVIATSASGAVVYSANVRVSQNITSVDAMLRAAMPEANITVTTVGQMAVLTGTVASPEDSAQAEALVRRCSTRASIRPKPARRCKIVPVNRLQHGDPAAGHAEGQDRRSQPQPASSQIGVNLLATDTTGGFKFGIAPGRRASTDVRRQPVPASTISRPSAPTLGAAGKLFGLDILGSLDLAEGDGLVTTLAEPNLTALSGETASFLAGGEYPIPVSQEAGRGHDRI